ncbi:hypothetical protein D9611_008949 [Ephemerocybe angulata]|uniref:Uncharacterized protein n=1 Tax=Ephemerocybe angulata TaxID=980116 RepID=A0A8H5BZD2_9AGAR|nr:hypothetical protein D9611_008949 [Tulosesus angulatus]
MATMSFSEHRPQLSPQARTRNTSLQSPLRTRRTSPSPTSKNNTNAVRPTPLYHRSYKHNHQGGATAGPSTIIRAPTCATIPSTTTTIDSDERPAKRARSEPPVMAAIEVNTIALPTTPAISESLLKQSQSSSRVSGEEEGRSMGGAENVCHTLEEVSEPESQGQSQDYSQSQSQSQRRSVSPTPTEVDDPEPEYVATQIRSLGVKILDFGFEPTPAHLAPIPELWDQYEAMAEFEFRLEQEPRVYPVHGKNLRRLLQIGWVDMEEVKERCEEMDMEELRRVDARPAWPFALKYNAKENRRKPSKEDKLLILQPRRYGYMRMDRLRKNAEQASLRREQEGQEAREKLDSIMRKGKGVLRDDEEGDIEFDRECEKYYGPSQCSQPDKQFPAPLSAYDPDIYPEAAGVIESQQSSQGRPVERPPRIDTPPLEEEKPVDRRPNALRRGLKRTLSRTQTFTQL